MPTALVLLSSIASFQGNLAHDLDFCFKTSHQNLQNHQLGFGDVVRQWNFIGNITAEQIGENSLVQNYQMFNDARAQYYNFDQFTNGYPAATGIGMDLPGVVLQTLAITSNPALKIIAIDNPWQIPAHQYSEKVAGREAFVSSKNQPKI